MSSATCHDRLVPLPRFIQRRIVLSLFVIIVAKYANAQTSLYIPGFEPLPVSADVLGVGHDGRITWALHKGEATEKPDDVEFIGTVTLVQGPHDVSLTHANSAAHFTIGEICSLAENFAVCTIVAGESTAVQTEAVSFFPVQLGSTIITSSLPITTSPQPGSLSLTSTLFSVPSTPVTDALSLEHFSGGPQTEVSGVSQSPSATSNSATRELLLTPDFRVLTGTSLPSLAIVVLCMLSIWLYE